MPIKQSPTRSTPTSASKSSAPVQLLERSAPSKPLQFYNGAGRGQNTRELAAQGTEGAAQKLPYLSRIQPSFGRHDITHIQAFVGGKAEQATEQLNAEGYATGESVVLRQGASLHTVAHEAAHVVQQRAGVSVEGGVGKKGDRYEQHANEVADAVVAGKKAEPILDRIFPGYEEMAAKPNAVQFQDAEEGNDIVEELHKALDGWSPDSAEIRAKITQATDDERARILADNSLVQKLSKKLKRADALVVLRTINADLKTQLTTAMSGWGADADTIKQITASASDDQKSELLQDAALIRRFKSELSRTDYITALENLNAPLKDTLEAALSGWGSDPAAITRLIEAADAANKNEVAKDNAFLTKILAELTPEAKNQACDTLFDGVTDLAAASNLFVARFNIKLGTSGDQDAITWLNGRGEAPIQLNGVKRLYNAFKNLPSDHVANLTHVITTDNSSGDAASGAASQSYFRMAYDETMTGDVESGAYTDDPADFTRGLNVLDTTAVHELAHILDGGRRYSSTPEFQAISGWTHFPVGKHVEVVAALQGDLKTPLPAGLTDTESKVAKEAAELLVKDRISDDADVEQRVTTSFTNQGLEEAGKTDGSDTYRSATDLTNELVNSDLFSHIMLGHEDNGIWKTEPYEYIDGKQYHEAYSWDGWYSYNTSARDTKFSWYQFRTSGEEFAELYATYHLTDPKGSKVPDDFKTWFEGQKLHVNNPDGAAGGGGENQRHGGHDHVCDHD